MRLLYKASDGSLKLTKDLLKDIPKYAILSHTWGEEGTEVNYDDIIDQKDYKEKSGYAKLDFCMRQMQEDKIDYVWIDTCCINKRDSPELSRSIRHMYQWYGEAEKCYALLSDIENSGTVNKPIVNSRWFTRGWTLQEMIAPRIVEFYSASGKYLGTKSKFANEIARKTGIDEKLMAGVTHIDSYPLKLRLSWASNRETTYAEDQVYCLIGLLGVKMGIDPGETKNEAMARLAKAMAKSVVDDVMRGQPGELATQEQGEEERGQQIAQEQNQAQRDADFNNVATKTPEEKRAEFMDSLYFETMHARRDQIGKPYQRTCQWLINHDSWREWQQRKINEQSSGTIWIKGKPGAGKSTLIKYANKRCPVSHKTICISFYFSARGSDLQHSTEGMYRSLLSQLINGRPEIQDLLLGSIDRHDRKTNRWSLPSLRKLLQAAVHLLSVETIYCFIDALDEADEIEVRHMIDHFGILGDTCAKRGRSLRVCFTSRHYPIISLPTDLDIILEETEEHHQDILRFVDDKLKIGDSDAVKNVRETLINKAQGVFMWVVLVVGLLNGEFLQGSVFRVQKIISALPSELGLVFKELIDRELQRDYASSNREERLDRFKHCIQWLLFSRRPLSSREFYCAMTLHDFPEAATEYDITVDLATRQRLVNSYSRGLAIVSKDKNETVQFIHETVRHWLLNDDEPRKLFTQAADVTTFKAHGHDVLKSACARYLLFETRFPRNLLNIEKWPLLSYCTENVFVHAEEAADTVSQGKFLSAFDFDKWAFLELDLHHRFPPRHAHALSQDCYCSFAAHNCVNLIQQASEQGMVIGGSEWPSASLFIALFTSRTQTIMALLSVYGIEIDQGIIDISTSEYKLRLSSRYEHLSLFRLTLEQRNFSLSFNLLQSDAYLEALINRNAEAQRRELMYMGQIAANRVAELRFHGFTLLFAAIFRAGDIIWTQTLLRWCLQSATLVMLATLGKEALTKPPPGAKLMTSSRAAWLANVDMSSVPPIHFQYEHRPMSEVDLNFPLVRSLIEYGADYHAYDGHGLTVLHKTCYEQALDIDHVPKFTGTAYINAERRIPMIKLLIEAGTRIEIKDRLQARTPLLHTVIWAIHDRDTVWIYDLDVEQFPHQIDQFSRKMIKFLLAEGASVDARDSDGCTSLLHVTRAVPHWPRMLKLLLQAGANPWLPDNTGESAMQAAVSRDERDLLACFTKYSKWRPEQQHKTANPKMGPERQSETASPQMDPDRQLEIDSPKLDSKRQRKLASARMCCPSAAAWFS